MRAQCQELCGKLAEDLAAEGLRGKTITLKLKTTGFEVRTRDRTLTRHISGADELFKEAVRLLRAEVPITIRLMVRSCFLIGIRLPTPRACVGGYIHADVGCSLEGAWLMHAAPRCLPAEDRMQRLHARSEMHVSPHSGAQSSMENNNLLTCARRL